MTYALSLSGLVLTCRHLFVQRPHAQCNSIVCARVTSRLRSNRPLSRRLDRCDRVIQNESRDPFGGNVYNVTMQITFLTRKFRNGERNLHCDVVHITTKWVSSLTLDCNGVLAIKAYAMGQCTCACVMAERRCSAHADVEQSDGGTLTARKPRDPLSSYII